MRIWAHTHIHTNWQRKMEDFFSSIEPMESTPSDFVTAPTLALAPLGSFGVQCPKNVEEVGGKKSDLEDSSALLPHPDVVCLGTGIGIRSQNKIDPADRGADEESGLQMKKRARRDRIEGEGGSAGIVASVAPQLVSFSTSSPWLGSTSSSLVVLNKSVGDKRNGSAAWSSVTTKPLSEEEDKSAVEIGACDVCGEQYPVADLGSHMKKVR